MIHFRENDARYINARDFLDDKRINKKEKGFSRKLNSIPYSESKYALALLLEKKTEVLLSQITQYNNSAYPLSNGSKNNKLKLEISYPNMLSMKSNPKYGINNRDNLKILDTRGASSAVSSQDDLTINYKGLNDIFWFWGRYIGYDITLIFIFWQCLHIYSHRS